MADNEKAGLWKNRIVGSGTANPADIIANPANWRLHPQAQRDALEGLLNEVGWVQDVIINKTTGLLLDGHLRVEIALARGETSIPVKYVELSVEEEALVLATLDPLGAMATIDAAQYDALLRDVETGNAAVQAMLAKTAQSAGLYEPPGEFPEYDENIADEVEYIECPQCGHRWPK